MTNRIRIIAALALTMVIGFAAGLRLDLSYDLGAFLPPPSTPAQHLLTQRLGQGPGAQLIFIRLQNSSYQRSTALAAQIRAHPHVRRVLPEEITPAVANIPAPLWRHRLLLGDPPQTSDEWLDVLRERIDDLMFAVDDELLNLIAADPALLSVAALGEFAMGAAEPVFNQGSTQYLMVETATAGFELNNQESLVADIRALLTPLPDATLLGSPVYAVDLQQKVRHEATLFSSIAGITLLLLMILRFRAFDRVISVALPMAAGGVSGLLALTVVFDAVHGITLAFGFTLLGITIDYPLHLLTHTTQGAATHRSIWPVLRLGIVSTLIAYGAFIFSGTPGLQQLGVFAFTGVIVAAAIAGWITRNDPTSIPDAHHQTQPAAQALRWWPGLTALAIAGGALSMTNLFNDDLSSLTPVEPNLLEADANIRQQLAVADIRYLISVRAASEELALQATEDALAQLAPLTASDALQGWQSITQILPSQRTQTARQAALTPAALLAFETAVAQLPLSSAAFAPFASAWEHQASNTQYLSVTDLLQDAQLGGMVPNLLFKEHNSWVSLIFLRGLQAPEAVVRTFDDQPNIELVDLKHTSEQLVRDYRRSLTAVLLLAAVLIGIVLSLRLNLQRTLWLVLNATAAVRGGTAVCHYLS